MVRHSDSGRFSIVVFKLLLLGSGARSWLSFLTEKLSNMMWDLTRFADTGVMLHGSVPVLVLIMVKIHCKCM